MMSKDQCKMAKMQCDISQVDAPSVKMPLISLLKSIIK